MKRYITAMVLPFLLSACASAAHHARPTPPPPPLQEHIPPNEAADTTALIKLFSVLVRREYAGGIRPAPRDAHPKGQGCVKATFTVRNGLPRADHYGLFAAPKSYRAWIRLSSGSPIPQSDTIGDGRGMAIKVIGFKGPKLLPDEKYTQDFVMINHPVFFSKNARDYLELNRAVLNGTQKMFLETHPRDAEILSNTISHVTRDMFAETFFSMSPYTLGPHYMKFRALPVRCPQGPALPGYPGSIPNDPNFLRARMANDLAVADACYQLQIQMQTNAATQPIEDPTVEWKTSEAPFATVADIVIPEQTFASAAQQTFCDNLSFTPWHGSTDQRPVGGINRIRLAVYAASSALRHDLNRSLSKKPTGKETFK